MDKNIIKSFAVDARIKLTNMVINQAGIWGITENKINEPVVSEKTFCVYQSVAGTEVTLSGNSLKNRNEFVNAIKERGFYETINEVAYTWFNRIIAIRFMEVNDYLPARVKVLSSEKKGKIEPDIITLAPNVNVDFSDDEIQYILNAKSENKYDELFRKIFIKQCEELNGLLPDLFENTTGYMNDMLNISYTNEDGIIRQLVDDIDEDMFNINHCDESGRKVGQIEIIGWLYQFYISAPKEMLINAKKIYKTDEIPYVTQLFTTDWIVQYLVDNTLGKFWVERNEGTKLVDNMQYLLKNNLTNIKEKIQPEDIKFFDPCMGSGHILLYAFDVLMDIYRERGYSDRDAAKSILENNIYGVDIDKRAYQMTYFTLLMKARSYNRRILSEKINLNICVIEDSKNLSVDYLKEHFNEQIFSSLISVLNQNKDSKAIGSLRRLKDMDLDLLQEEINVKDNNTQISIDNYYYSSKVKPRIDRILKQSKILNKEYTVVCTNPPYMANNLMPNELKTYIEQEYQGFKNDTFSAFMIRCMELCKKNGYVGMLTPYVWMFISAFSELREFIISNKQISSLVQLEYNAFPEACVPVCAFTIKNEFNDDNGTYIKLSSFKGANIQGQKVLEAINSYGCNYLYEKKAKKFNLISGSPIAFWLSDSAIETFAGKKIDNYIVPRIGLITGDNNRFLRLWYEPYISNIGYGVKNIEESIASEKKWFPYHKGGEFRKWYGNQEYVVDWENDGYEMKYNNSVKGRVRSHNYNGDFSFQEGITWSSITSGTFSCRYSPAGFLFDAAGPLCKVKDKANLFLILGFLTSKVATEFLSVLNPTINMHPGYIQALPFDVEDYQDSMTEIEELVKECIEIEKDDWDAYETSWNFKKHPLLEGHSIKKACQCWEKQINEKRQKLKENEERINKIIITKYGLGTELSSEVDEKDITITEFNQLEAIKSLISYAVGCMFGRYSLKANGIACADKCINFECYESYLPDKDNIIPITDEEYFDDDIVSKFISFLVIAYGEEQLEENLLYIAKSLEEKSTNARETIRKYFLNNFFQDHCNRYTSRGAGKRPIYWQFDSGKQNGFKALIYIHRYDRDCVGRIRTDYLHKVQGYIEVSIKNAEYTISNNTSPIEKSRLTKLISKYTKQLAELRIYDEAIAHIASCRYDLDMDAGIKENYEIFQGTEVAQEGKKTIIVDILTRLK